MESSHFMLRNIVSSLHLRWKIISKLRGMTMRKYLLLALSNQIEHDEAHLDDTQRKTEGGDLE